MKPPVIVCIVAMATLLVSAPSHAYEIPVTADAARDSPEQVLKYELGYEIVKSHERFVRVSRQQWCQRDSESESCESDYSDYPGGGA